MTKDVSSPAWEEPKEDSHDSTSPFAPSPVQISLNLSAAHSRVSMSAEEESLSENITMNLLLVFMLVKTSVTFSPPSVFG